LDVRERVHLLPRTSFCLIPRRNKLTGPIKGEEQRAHD
jgi:hypothetical protein